MIADVRRYADELAAEFRRTCTLAFINSLGSHPRSAFYLNGAELHRAAAELLTAIERTSS